MTQSHFGIAPEVLQAAARKRKADLAGEKDRRIARMAVLAVDGRDLATGAVQPDAGEKGRGQSGLRTCVCGRTFYAGPGKTVCSRCRQTAYRRRRKSSAEPGTRSAE